MHYYIIAVWNMKWIFSACRENQPYSACIICVGSSHWLTTTADDDDNELNCGISVSARPKCIGQWIGHQLSDCSVDRFLGMQLELMPNEDYWGVQLTWLEHKHWNGPILFQIIFILAMCSCDFRLIQTILGFIVIPRSRLSASLSCRS